MNFRDAYCCTGTAAKRLRLETKILCILGTSYHGSTRPSSRVTRLRRDRNENGSPSMAPRDIRGVLNRLRIYFLWYIDIFKLYEEPHEGVHSRMSSCWRVDNSTGTLNRSRLGVLGAALPCATARVSSPSSAARRRVGLVMVDRTSPKAHRRRGQRWITTRVRYPRANGP